MNCQQGELAVIVRSIHPENLERVVEVLEPDGLGNWRVRAMFAPLKLTRIHSGQIGWSMEAWCPDADLRPIRPNAKPSQQTVSEPSSKAA